MTTKPVILPEYAALNKQLHAESANYGANASARAVNVVEISRMNKFNIILDYGCGKGTLRPAVKKIAPDLKVLEFDPAIKGKDTIPSRRPDLVVVLDVMEHIEPDYLDSVLSTIRNLTPQAVLMTIATEAAQKTLPDGRNAHLIVQPTEWWLERLQTYFKPLKAQPLEDHHFLFFGTPLPSGLN